MALIEDEPVIENILKHLHLWDPCTQSQAPPTEDIDWPSNSHTTLGASEPFVRGEVFPARLAWRRGRTRRSHIDYL